MLITCLQARRRPDRTQALALVLALLGVTLCVKLDITGYQHRVPDAEDVTSVRFHASYADFTTDDPAAVESVISLHRAILEQYDETGERLENQTYLDTEGGPITRYVRVDYQLRNGTSLRREWRVSIVNGSDIHRLLTQLVNRTDSRAGMIGISRGGRLCQPVRYGRICRAEPAAGAGAGYAGAGGRGEQQHAHRPTERRAVRQG